MTEVYTLYTLAVKISTGVVNRNVKSLISLDTDIALFDPLFEVDHLIKPHFFFLYETKQSNFMCILLNRVH